ncbi:MAG: outer membrane beta-barrel protein [Sphingobacteriia bacterium]|nr:outer membrane beta-barrel protein [Sphingobacteriia bacterium]
MLKRAGFIFLMICSWSVTKAQLMESFVHTGEFGVGIGLGHYFGDLNPDAQLNSPKLAFGIFYRKQLTNYVGVRVSGEYALLGYSDRYSDNSVQRRRNLSFNSNVYEFSVSGDFNFFRFQPGFEGYNFTPYIGLGVGVFSYDPYAYLNGQKYLLRPLGTEGQGSALYPNLNPYGNTAIAIPFTLGIKYALNPRMNFFAELVYRVTNTDYLDDVSGQYAPDAFAPLPDGSASPAFLLQDRSYETGTSIGVKGRQRGNSLKADAFATLKVGLSFNLQTYRCPTN